MRIKHLLLPDDWSISTYSLSNTNNANANYTKNILNASQWSILEQVGAVFLPAAGYRDGISVSGYGVSGVYWSASHAGPPGYSKAVWFTGAELHSVSSWPVSEGCSVRLIQDN